MNMVFDAGMCSRLPADPVSNALMLLRRFFSPVSRVVFEARVHAAHYSSALAVGDLTVIARCIASDLPSYIPVDREEIALIRAFLGDDIRAIMQDEE